MFFYYAIHEVKHQYALNIRIRYFPLSATAEFVSLQIRWQQIQFVIDFSVRHSASSQMPRWRHQMETFSLVTDPLWGEFTGHRSIPFTKASDAELWWFLWSAPEQTIEQTIGTLVIWNAIVLIMTSLLCPGLARLTRQSTVNSTEYAHVHTHMCTHIYVHV